MPKPAFVPELRETEPKLCPALDILMSLAELRLRGPNTEMFAAESTIRPEVPVALIVTAPELFRTMPDPRVTCPGALIVTVPVPVEVAF